MTLARRRNGTPRPPPTTVIHITYDSYDRLVQTKIHTDEPMYMVLTRFIGKYDELKNISFQEYLDLKQELEQYKEHLSIAEFEINRVKRKNRDLEDTNERLLGEVERLLLLRQQQPDTIEI